MNGKTGPIIGALISAVVLLLGWITLAPSGVTQAQMVQAIPAHSPYTADKALLREMIAQHQAGLERLTKEVVLLRIEVAKITETCKGACQ